MEQPRQSALVLDADGRSGLACVQSLGQAGVEMHVGVRSRGSTTERSRWCHQVHLQPRAEPLDDAVAWLSEMDRRHGFSLVIPTTEASLRWLRRLPQDDPVRAKAVLPTDAAIDAALDKERTRELAQQLGLPVPASRMLKQGELPPPAQGPFPKVLKPVHSKVVIGTRLVTLAVVIARDAAAREATLAAWLPFTAVQEQEWVPGRGVGVEVLYDRGRMAWHFVHERLHEMPLTGGASTLRRAAGAEHELVAMSSRLLDHLGWHGVAMVEWRRDEQGNVRLMEINPRLWGSLPLTIAAGVDMPRGLLTLAQGRPLAPAPAPAWRVGQVARNLPEDLEWFIANLRADRTDPLLLTQSPWRALLGLLRGLVGRERWDGWTIKDPAVALAEQAGMLRKRLGALARRVHRFALLRRARRHHERSFGAGAKPARPVSSVLFLCLGNICRSPFAAVAATSRLRGVNVASAGFHPREGRPSPLHVVEAARSLGVDLGACASTRVTKHLIDGADLIVVMDLANLELLSTEFPDALPRTTLLGLFERSGPAEIVDPYELAPQPTRAVLIQILCALDAMAAWLPGAMPI